MFYVYFLGLGKCYTKEEAVKATCPDDRAVHERKFKEIMLYRKFEYECWLKTFEILVSFFKTILTSVPI